MLLLFNGCSSEVSSDKTQYESYVSKCVGSNEFLPTATDIINNDRFSYKFYEDNSVFAGCGIVVAEQLDTKDFENKKKELESRLNYLSEPIYNEVLGMLAIPQVEFKVDNYMFRVLLKKSEMLSYPKSFGMIAISETENTIMYFAYYSPDLDYIEDMTDFVKTHFPGWNR